MLRPGFELFIAWRHLRDPERRSHRTLWFGLALLILGGLGLAVAALAPRLLHLPIARPRRVDAAPTRWSGSKT